MPTFSSLDNRELSKTSTGKLSADINFSELSLRHWATFQAVKNVRKSPPFLLEKGFRYITSKKRRYHADVFKNQKFHQKNRLAFLMHILKTASVYFQTKYKSKEPVDKLL